MIPLDPASISEDVRRLNPELDALVHKKPPKYHNRRTFAVDRTFESGLEAVRAGELALLEREREIFCLCYQVVVPLPGGIKYVADFVYLDKQLQVHVEDAKGVRTADYKNKKKLFEERYGVKITEIEK